MSSTMWAEQFTADRDALLTKLAMELHPDDFDHGEPYHWGEFQFTGDEYLQRRAELIDRPSWDEAPEWAEWLVYAPKSESWNWCWGNAPISFQDGINGIKGWSVDAMSSEHAAYGKLPEGIDWRDTLEKRPMDHITTSLGATPVEDRDAIIREMARVVSPDEWAQGGHMRYKGHTITWGEYAMARARLEEEFSIEPWPEERMDAIGANGPTGDHYAEAPCGADSSACLLNPCPTCDIMTPEEEDLPAEERHDCERCGGSYWSPMHEVCPCLDAGAHYRREYQGVKLDPYRIAKIYDMQGGPREQIMKKCLRFMEKGQTEREVVNEIRTALERWEEMLGEDGQ